MTCFVFSIYEKGNAPERLSRLSLSEWARLAPTRVLSKKYGAPSPTPRFQQAGSSPGNRLLQTLQDQFRYESLNAETEVYGVIADPIAHSLSPLIHNVIRAY